MQANVIVEYPVKALDKCFTYNVPSNMQSELRVGMKVLVPFGSLELNGIVLELKNESTQEDLKSITRIVNKDIILNEEQILLSKYMQSKTFCPLISAFQTMLPSALKIKDQKKNYDKFDTYYVLDKDEDTINKYIVENENRAKQLYILEEILKNGEVSKKEFNSSSAKTLLQKGLIKEVKKEKYRINQCGVKDNPIVLNEEQQNAYQSVIKNEHNIYLLQGVTGSGKTEVYMHLIDDVIKKGQSAIVLVPEISLTTQTVKRFYDRFGTQVAVFHSGLTPGEKYDEYKKIYAKKVQIVVGTRSSIFVPLTNIGIIIIDEEHSDTYRQDVSPRYDAIDMAIYRAKYHNCPLVLASATPSLESKARALKGVYKLLLLNKRVNGQVLPSVDIVNMENEIKEGNYLISGKLKDKIIQRLNNKEQIILLLNRRGFSTFVSCSSCGYTYKCPNCDITLTYHKTTNNLRCHYCGYAVYKDKVCPSCKEDSLNYLGVGTQKVEQILNESFPNAKVIRMDQDTTTRKGSYQKIIDDFADNKYDILLGTQMISKGLDFKNVTLVGILNADTSLNIPDFRANEKTFSLLYQTSGRCGRDKKRGEVIIQSFNPENKVLNFVKDNDFEGFFAYEMNIRHKLKYPPYTYIAYVLVKSRDYEIASKKANEIKRSLDGNKDNGTMVFGPTPAGVFKVNNVYHFGIIIKYTFDNKLLNMLNKLDKEYILDKDVNVEISFNPSRF